MSTETRGRNRKKKAGHVSLAEVRSLVEGQGYKCWATGVDVTPRLSSLDHKTSRKNGGNHEIDNLCVMHPVVNAAKGSLNFDQFVHLCHLVASKHADTGDLSWWDMAPQE